MAATNFFYTDIAAAQVQGANFPGAPGSSQIGSPPTTQNRAILEGPSEITAVYVWSGTEAQFDTINIAILPAGTLVSPSGRVCSGGTAPASVLTMAIGDDDMGLLSELPIPNYAGGVTTIGLNDSLQAPVWVTGTSYVKGNLVVDAASSPSNRVYICILAVSGSTAPSSDSTHWTPFYSKYSGSIDVHAASGNVLFAAGTGVLAGLPPYSGTIGTLPTGYTTTQLAAQPWIIRNDCWLQALLLTASTPVAGAVTVFHVPLIASN